MKNWMIAANLFLLLIVGCSKSESIPGDHGAISALENKSFFEEVGAVKPYRTNNPDTAKMNECIYADTNEKSCTVSSLPLIGLSKNQITVDDILDRTFISQDFLGETFKQVLLRLNPEILQMFGAVSAVVISDKVNPSFYYSVTGTIYLSGRYFWRNAEELKLLNQVKDFRAEMGLPLQFAFNHDYIINGKSITSRADRNTQTYDEMAIVTARLLFHELTHANDYFPRRFYKSSNIDISKTYQKIAHDRFVTLQLASDQEVSKVSSAKLSHIGQILFQGAKASAEDSSILADDIISEFKNDVASDSYAYSNSKEDYAMLAEEALMLHYYNISRYTFIIKYPEAYFTPPQDFSYPIVWGEKSRVLEPNIKPRAYLAVENDLGLDIGKKVRAKLDPLSPVDIPANTNWDDLYKL
ncbi:MAG: hypothetical protein Q7U04_09485 [Bacteriovorax sp.]|nr:hypothetical protein [Bacteriovorax sp.]